LRTAAAISARGPARLLAVGPIGERRARSVIRLSNEPFRPSRSSRFAQDLRDQILATGMTGGMETSYARLESMLAVTA
jgi:hypothetical protein